MLKCYFNPTWKPVPILPPLFRTYLIMSFPFFHIESLFSMKNLLKPILFTLSVLKWEACNDRILKKQDNCVDHHQKVVHAVSKVINNNSVEVVRVALESSMNRITGPRDPVISRCLTFVLKTKDFFFFGERSSII